MSETVVVSCMNLCTSKIKFINLEMFSVKHRRAFIQNCDILLNDIFCGFFFSFWLEGLCADMKELVQKRICCQSIRGVCCLFDSTASLSGLHGVLLWIIHTHRKGGSTCRTNTDGMKSPAYAWKQAFCYSLVIRLWAVLVFCLTCGKSHSLLLIFF